MKSKRWIAMVVAAVLAVSMMAGCQQSGSSSDAGTESKGSVGAVPSGDPVKIKVGSTSQLMTAPCNWYETDTFKEVTKQANVEIEYMFYDEEKFNMLLAGDDLPDVMFAAYPKKLPDIIGTKKALDLKPYFDTYPNLNADAYKQCNEIISGFYGGDEKKLYFLGNYVGLELKDGGVQNWRGYNVRWDWYKEIGAPYIKDRDDYISALEQMVAKHPTTDDGKKVYGSGIAGTGLEVWYTNGCFTKPAMMNPWTFGGYLYMEAFEDGKLYNGYTNIERSAYWADMEFYNILFNKGLFDPDSFTMTDEERQAKSAAGQYAAELCWMNGDLYAAEVEKDPNTLAGIITIPNEASLVFADYHQVSGYFPSNFIFVSAKSNAIEGALSFLNVMRDVDVERMLYSGFEGTHWKVVDGVPTPTEETLALRAAAGDEWKKTGIENLFNFGMLQGSYLAEDGYPVNLFDTDAMRKAGLNPLYQDYADFYKVDYPAQACTKIVDEGKTVDMSNCYSELNQSCTETLPTDIQRILTQCNDILFEAIPKLVQAKDAAEFKSIQDQVLADLKDANEETAWEWCLNANTKAQEFTKPITDSLDW